MSYLKENPKCQVCNKPAVTAIDIDKDNMISLCESCLVTTDKADLYEAKHSNELKR